MKKRNEIIINVFTLVLLVASLVFLGISIFGKSKSNLPLQMALACIFVGNLINVIKKIIKKRKNI